MNKIPDFNSPFIWHFLPLMGCNLSLIYLYFMHVCQTCLYESCLYPSNKLSLHLQSTNVLTNVAVRSNSVFHFFCLVLPLLCSNTATQVDPAAFNDGASWLAETQSINFRVWVIHCGRLAGSGKVETHHSARCCKCWMRASLQSSDL